MKIRNYEVENLSKSALFCPNCHRKVNIPIKGEIKIENSMHLMCGDCKNGKLIVRMKKVNNE